MRIRAGGRVWSRIVDVGRCPGGGPCPRETWRDGGRVWFKTACGAGTVRPTRGEGVTPLHSILHRINPFPDGELRELCAWRATARGQEGAPFPGHRRLNQPPGRSRSAVPTLPEIGRASCRERV